MKHRSQEFSVYSYYLGVCPFYLFFKSHVSCPKILSLSSSYTNMFMNIVKVSSGVICVPVLLPYFLHLFLDDLLSRLLMFVDWVLVWPGCLHLHFLQLVHGQVPKESRNHIINSAVCILSYELPKWGLACKFHGSDLILICLQVLPNNLMQWIHYFCCSHPSHCKANNIARKEFFSVNWCMICCAFLNIYLVLQNANCGSSS